MASPTAPTTPGCTIAVTQSVSVTATRPPNPPRNSHRARARACPPTASAIPRTRSPVPDPTSTNRSPGRGASTSSTQDRSLPTPGSRDRVSSALIRVWKIGGGERDGSHHSRSRRDNLDLVSDLPAVPDPRDMRVSNDDRERVAKVLHESMAEGRLTVTELEERLDKVYAAKTFGDLEPLTRDLPVGNAAKSIAIPRPAAPSSTRIGGRGTSSTAIAILSGAVRKGGWTVPPTFNTVAVMGGVEIDLTDARFEDAETTIQAFALMGGIEIYVPRDIVVQVNGTGFMGAFESNVDEDLQPRPGVPVVKITGLAVMGGVDIKYRKPPKQKDKHKQLEE
jgi:uncharacterized protein DUF1707/cell wall-active antibiotic response 4TMS protein YvqF